MQNTTPKASVYTFEHRLSIHACSATAQLGVHSRRGDVEQSQANHPLTMFSLSLNLDLT